ncbi:hypothetical protein [Streptomyces sclerotialus]|uniref:hypothetical protein n=1 Tax=Streptomyces sclerotialus TaxID=1957 RepID=UPI0018CACF85
MPTAFGPGGGHSQGLKGGVRHELCQARSDAPTLLIHGRDDRVAPASSWRDVMS